MPSATHRRAHHRAPSRNCHILSHHLQCSQTRFAEVGQQQVLKAMQAGSTDARDRLPSILGLARDQPSLWQTLQEQLDKPPKWMYLGWASQAAAILG